MPELFVAGDTHQGKRKQQQDAHGFTSLNDPELQSRLGVAAVVADGMGGLADGKRASDTAVHAVLAALEANGGSVEPPKLLHGAVQLANKEVAALNSGRQERCGSTLAVALVQEDRLYWVSTGDSRVFLVRSGRRYQLTSDHTYGRILRRKAADETDPLTREEALSHEQRTHLTSHLGVERVEELDLSLRPLSLLEGDRIILCSDGLYNAVTEEEMVEAFYQEPEQAAERLKQTALRKNRPGQDNLTIAVIGYGPPPPRPIRYRPVDEEPTEVIPPKRTLLHYVPKPVRLPILIAAALLVSLILLQLVGNRGSSDSTPDRTEGSTDSLAAGKAIVDTTRAQGMEPGMTAEVHSDTLSAEYGTAVESEPDGVVDSGEEPTTGTEGADAQAAVDPPEIPAPPMDSNNTNTQNTESEATWWSRLMKWFRALLPGSKSTPAENQGTQDVESSPARKPDAPGGAPLPAGPRDGGSEQPEDPGDQTNRSQPIET